MGVPTRRTVPVGELADNVDEFLRFVASSSAAIDFDSFLSTGHNYFLYVNPADGLVHFIPWALNMTFGGYPSVPTILAASFAGIPTVLHEQNAILGRANRLLARRATRIAASFPGSCLRGCARRVTSMQTAGSVWRWVTTR